MKRIVCVIFIAFAVVFSNISAYAADFSMEDQENQMLQMSPQYTGISILNAGLSIDSGGKATCSGAVVPSSNSYTSYLTVSLQQRKGTGWSTIISWNDSGAGFNGADLEGYYYVVSGTYRVCSTASVYNSSGSLIDKESFYSAERTY